MDIYCVGGAVRDELLGLPVRDRDWVVVGALPETLINRGFSPVGRSFPVFLHPETKEEYALARKERKVGRGYQGFECVFDPSVTLEEDLSRRDLTINAIAKNTDGTLIDPHHGQQDLHHKILRHVSPAFIEDPLRVLRVARFMARFAPLGFTVAPETLALMKKMVQSGELADLTPERVWMEMHKALSEPAPQAFIQTLRACDALAIILPEVNALYGVTQPPQYHPEIDTGIHIEMVLEQAALLSHNPMVRFAALLHDVGKGLTPQHLWPKHHGHEETGWPVVKKMCERLKAPKEYTTIAVLVARYHGLFYKIEELKPTTILKVLNHIDIFRKPERLELFSLASEADFRGRPGFEKLSYPQVALWARAAAAARSVDISAHITPNMTGEQIDKKCQELRAGAIAKAIRD